MNRQEAIDILSTHYEPDDQRLEQALDMAIEALKAPQWTPCSERLPEEKGEYMVTVEYCWHGETGRMLTSTRYTKTKGWHISEGKVIAWMPEPEPYKEE